MKSMEERLKEISDDPKRMTPEDRYYCDPSFRMLVAALENMIHTANFTPTELREAAVFAAIRYESRRMGRTSGYESSAVKSSPVDAPAILESKP